MNKTISAIALSFAMLLVATAASANARQHFLAGQNYYTQGRYEKAIEEFEEAYRLDPRPLLLFNISQAWEKMGDLPKSLDFLKRFLEAEPDNEDRTTLLSKVANLESRITATGIKVTCNEAEATVYVNGKEVGKTPLATVIPLNVGAHKVQISKKGFQDYAMNLSISSGQTTPVDATLEPGKAGAPPVTAPGDGDTGDGKEEPAPEEGAVEALDVVPWVIAGVGAAAAIVGLGVVGGMAMG
ncbi:MAG TPA: PEGA domain-containing protein, partial [Polyangia bacterium]|nr:PEGA domain-containing protein [Polyangia bacterium]